MARAEQKTDGEQPVDRRKRAVRVKAATLHAALKDVLGVVGAKDTIPILGNVLFHAGDGRIELTATDLDCWAVRDLASDDRDGPSSKEWIKSIRGFTVTLPARPLSDVLGEIDGDAMVTIALETEDGAPDDLTENYSGKVTVSAGRARFRLHCLPAADFPRVPPCPSEHSFEMACSALADAFAAVEHAISSEVTRYYLNGVFMHPAQVPGGPLDFRMAATDGHRLARLSFDAPDGAASFPAAIVGRRTVALLDKLLAAAARTTEGKEVTPAQCLVESACTEQEGGYWAGLIRYEMPAADGGTIEIIAKTIDGQFPDYQRVIPSEPRHRATVNRQELATVVKRVAVLASGKTRHVKIEFHADRLTISASSPELGEASEEVECEYDGPEGALGFDSRYLREALGTLASDTVALQFDGADTQPPVRIVGWQDNGEVGQLVQVLMPVAIP